MACDCVFANAGHYLALVIGVLVILRSLWGILKFVSNHFFVSSYSFKKFANTWAVITGASDGIGKAYAFELAKNGLNVCLLSRTQSKLNEVKGEIEAKYPNIKVEVIAVDFTNNETFKHLSTLNSLKQKETSILVNNVGISYDYPMPFLDISEKLMDDLITANISTMNHMTRLILPGMVQRKHGVVINVSSFSGVFPVPLLAVYSATKAYVDHFSQALQYEYKSSGIIVQSTTPAFVATNMTKVSRARLTIPAPITIVKNSLARIGSGVSISPYWFHDLQESLLKLLPRSFTISQIFKTNLKLRAAALRKMNK